MDISGQLYDFFTRIGMNPDTVVFVFSLIPLIELRGAMPVGVAIGLTPFRSWLFSFLGSVVAVPLSLALFRPVLGFLKRKKAFYNAVYGFELQLENKAAKIVSRAEQRSKKTANDTSTVIKIYKMVMSALFVAVPLPMTGVWTGTALAACLGLSNIEVLIAVTLGQLVASILVALLVFCFSDQIDTVLFIMLIIIAVGITVFIWKRVIKVFVENRRNGNQ